MVANVVVLTEVVVIVKDALLALAGTVTVAGVCAAALLSERLTTKPLLGAGPVKVTVPLEEVPPTTPVGFTLTVESPGGVMVKDAVRVTPLLEAETVTVVELETGTVVTAKVAVLALAATVTLAGAVAAALLSERVTKIPPLGAGAFRVTVPVEELPPTTLVGLILTEASQGLMVRVAVRVVPL
jgi:hypothetical protein